MKHIRLILVVCLLLAVFGSTTASAESLETVTTITVKLGPQLAEQDDVANQICDIAALHIHSMPEGYGAFVLSLNGNDVFESLFKAEPEGVYAQTGIFGEQPLYFTWADIQEFYLKQLENNADMMEMNGMFNMGLMQSMMDGSMTEEEALASMGIDEELMAFVGDVQAKQVTETGTFALNGSDIADQKLTTVLEKEDLQRAVDLPIVRKQIASQLQTSSPELSQEEIDQAVDAQLEEVKQAIEDGNLTVKWSVYKANGEFVALEILASGGMDEAKGGLSIAVTRTTIDTAKFYQLSVKIYEGDQEFLNQYGSLYVSDAFVTGKYTVYSMPDVPAFEAALNADLSETEHFMCDLALTMHDFSSDGDLSIYVVFDQRTDTGARDTAIELYTGSDIGAIKAAFDKSKLITVNFHTVEQPDGGFFAALENATPETSVQLLQMTEDELNAYMTGMEQSMMTTVMTVIDNLPPDIRDPLMEQMGGF